MSFVWIAVFSFLLSTIISRWSTLMGVPTILLGATLVAMGGEVPDTIQSIAVAKRGYGVGAPRGPLHGGRSTRAAPRWSLHEGALHAGRSTEGSQIVFILTCAQY